MQVTYRDPASRPVPVVMSLCLREIDTAPHFRRTIPLAKRQATERRRPRPDGGACFGCSERPPAAAPCASWRNHWQPGDFMDPARTQIVALRPESDHASCPPHWDGTRRGPVRKPVDRNHDLTKKRALAVPSLGRDHHRGTNMPSKKDKSAPLAHRRETPSREPPRAAAHSTGTQRQADDPQRLLREAAWTQMFGRTETKNPFTR